MGGHESFVRICLFFFLLSFSLVSSSCEDVLSPGPLVPPTVDEDGRLPSITISVAGHERKIHVRTWGDTSNPVLMVAPGSLSDIRAYLPFASFSDRYFVVLWDLRGNGLSERVTAGELSFDAMVEEMHQVKLHYSPSAPVTVVGHSWSAAFAAMYLSKYPSDTEQAILMEPPGLKAEYMKDSSAILNLTSAEYCNLVWFQGSLAPTDHEKLDFSMLAMLDSGVRDFFVDRDHRPPWPVWRVGGYALIVWERALVGRTGSWDYDMSVGLDGYPHTVLIVGSSHSPIGYAFQERTNARVFRSVKILGIENSGHRMITEQWAQLDSGLRGYLARYQGGTQP
jgi:proline iminopeptidase